MKNFFQNPNGMCEDAPCCGCCGSEDVGELPDNFGAEDMGDDLSEFADDEPEADDEPQGSHDLSDDAEALASAGWGTDEDYGGFDAADYYWGEE